jgi:tetratricopeptide (TPR) repeat protein
MSQSSQHTTDALLTDGRHQLAQSRLDAAIDCFNRVIAQDPQHAIAYRELAVAYGKKGNFKNELLCNLKAYKFYVDYVSKYPGELPVLTDIDAAEPNWDVKRAQYQTIEILEDLLREYRDMHHDNIVYIMRSEDIDAQRGKLFKIIEKDLCDKWDARSALKDLRDHNNHERLAELDALVNSISTGLEGTTPHKKGTAIKLQSKLKEESCVILSVFDVKYDNLLLNNSKLLDCFQLKHGVGITSRLISLTGELDLESVQEICDSGNALEQLEILMSGLTTHSAESL